MTVARSQLVDVSVTPWYHVICGAQQSHACAYQAGSRADARLERRRRRTKVGSVVSTASGGLKADHRDQQMGYRNGG